MRLLRSPTRANLGRARSSLWSQARDRVRQDMGGRAKRPESGPQTQITHYLDIVVSGRKPMLELLLMLGTFYTIDLPDGFQDDSVPNADRFIDQFEPYYTGIIRVEYDDPRSLGLHMWGVEWGWIGSDCEMEWVLVERVEVDGLFGYKALTEGVCQEEVDGEEQSYDAREVFLWLRDGDHEWSIIGSSDGYDFEVLKQSALSFELIRGD